MIEQLFRRKPTDQILSDSDLHEYGLKRSLSVWDITALGIGAIIGTGIFSLTGTAAAGTQGAAATSWIDTPILNLMLGDEIGRAAAGPALVFSFLLAALCCFFAALCYAEFTAMVPVAGSAYTFGYAGLGELAAWIIGWDLILEYAIGNVTVALSWGDYFVALAHNLTGWRPHLWMVKDHGTAQIILNSPERLAEASKFYASTSLPFGFAVNLPAILVVALVTVLLIYGIRESARVNSVMVAIKLGIVLFFIAFGAFYVNPVNWKPFAPTGFSGIMGAAPIVFFAFIGFDAVSTTAEEAKNPQRDLPLAIIWSLAISSVLYVLVTLVLTGMLPFKAYFDDAAPVATALKATGQRWAEAFVNAGALAAMTTVLIVYQLGQPRIFLAMARDGLLPKLFKQVHPKFRTPVIPTILTGVIVVVGTLMLDINKSAELTSIGTLFAYVVVCLGIWILRRTDPNRERPFRTPLVPLVPILGIGLCAFLMLSLPVMTWVRFIGWLVLGGLFYAFYGYRNSELHKRSQR